MEKAITPPLVVENTTPFVPLSLTLRMPGKLKRLADWKRLLASRAGLWLARIRVAGVGGGLFWWGGGLPPEPNGFPRGGPPGPVDPKGEEKEWGGGGVIFLTTAVRGRVFCRPT